MGLPGALVLDPVGGLALSAPAPVFVTGGTGVVGRPIVQRLVAQERPVTASARSDEARRTLERLGATPVHVDVTDESALTDAMRGCAVAYHVAGVNQLCVREYAELERVNVLGSANVVRAAARAGVDRLVYTSSAVTLGEPRGATGDEATRHRGWFLSRYERSKVEAERAVLALAVERGVEVVCVNPSSVQGPGRSGGTTRLLRALLDGKLKVYVDTRVSLVDIEDCAAGHLLAEANGAPGERYVLSGATLRASEALVLVAGAAGLLDRPRCVPGWAAMAAAAVVEAAARVTGRTAPVCREMVRTLVHGHAYDGSRAARELGLVYTPVEETLRRTVLWLVDEGHVRRPLPGIDALRAG